MPTVPDSDTAPNGMSTTSMNRRLDSAGARDAVTWKTTLDVGAFWYARKRALSHSHPVHKHVIHIQAFAIPISPSQTMTGTLTLWLLGIATGSWAPLFIKLPGSIRYTG